MHAEQARRRILPLVSQSRITRSIMRPVTTRRRARTGERLCPSILSSQTASAFTICTATFRSGVTILMMQNSTRNRRQFCVILYRPPVLRRRSLGAVLGEIALRYAVLHFALASIRPVATTDLASAPPTTPCHESESKVYEFIVSLL